MIHGEPNFLVETSVLSTTAVFRSHSAFVGLKDVRLGKWGIDRVPDCKTIREARKTFRVTLKDGVGVRDITNASEKRKV